MIHFLVLVISLVLFVPTTRAGDTDIIPERTSMIMKTQSYDPLTGVLHGSIQGPAGTGNVTVLITPETKPRRGGLRLYPDTPNRALAELWNLQIGRPAPVFGPVSSSPFSLALTQVVAQQGYLKLKLKSDLSGVKVVKPSWPKTAIDVCQPLTSTVCCVFFDPFGVLEIRTSDPVGILNGCTQLGATAADGPCFPGTSLAAKKAYCLAEGIDSFLCSFQADDPAPYTCSSVVLCTNSGIPTSLCTSLGGNVRAF